MLVAPEHPNSIRIRLCSKKFECTDAQVEGRIDPRARPKFDEFVDELNKTAKKKCLRFPYFIYFFLLGYLASFIAIMYTGKYFLLFIPITCFACFIAGIIWFSVSVHQFVNSVNKIIDKYRVELAPYYNVVNQLSMYRRRYDYSSTDQAIVLIPVVSQMPVMPGQYYMAPMQNMPMQGQYNPNMQPMQGQFNPNMQPAQGQYFPQNGFVNGQQMQGGYQVPPVNMMPPQPIPVYNYNPQNLQDITNMDIEDDPVLNKNKGK